jgi:cell division septal protein FtsQ
MSEKKHHWVMYSIFVVLVIIIVGGYFAYRMYFPKEQIVSSGQQWTPIEVTAENLPSVIESTPVVKDLPPCAKY